MNLQALDMFRVTNIVKSYIQKLLIHDKKQKTQKYNKFSIKNMFKYTNVYF